MCYYLCVQRWLMRSILALNCLLQIEQERSEEESSVGDTLTLAFHCARFCLASLILFALYSPAPFLMRPCHFVRSHDSIGMLKSLREALRVSLYHFFWPPWERFPTLFSIEDLFWQTFIKHSGNMACPSQLCQFQKSMYILHPCLFQDFCVWNPVLPLYL